VHFLGKAGYLATSRGRGGGLRIELLENIQREARAAGTPRAA